MITNKPMLIEARNRGEITPGFAASLISMTALIVTSGWHFY